MLPSGYLRLSLSLIMSILCWPVAAQEWGFERLGTEHGLPSSEAYNMALDEKGYVWVATENGVVKYNGRRFVPVCTNIPPRERTIYAFQKSARGALCFSNSQYNIYTTRNDSAFLAKGSAKIAAAIPRYYPLDHFYIDSPGNIYLNTAANSFLYLGDRDLLLDIPVPKDNNDDIIEEIDGNYLSIIRRASPVNIRVRNTVYAGVYPTVSRSGRTGNTVVKNEYGLYLLRFDGLTRITPDHRTQVCRLPGNAITLFSSPDGHLWVGMDKDGLLELDKDLHILHHYLAGIGVAAILFDRQQGLWVSSLNQGIFHCRNVHQRRYENVEGMTEEITLAKVAGDHLFIGSYSGRLLIIGNEGQRLLTTGNRQSTYPQDVIEWREQYLVAAKGGVFRIHSSLSETGLSTLSTEFSYALIPNQDRVISASGVVFRFLGKGLPHVDSILTTIRVRNIIPLGDKDYLAGTSSGLYYYPDYDTCFIPSYLAPLKNSNILRLKKDAYGNAWIGTRGDGLWVLRPGQRLQRVPTPDDIVTNIDFLRDSILLLCTNAGLYCKSRSALLAGREWRFLYEGEVLHAVPYREKIYIGTKHGLVACDTMSLFHPPPFPVYLSSVSAKGRKIGTGNIRLRHNENDLYLTFDVLCYSRRPPPLFYRLNGPLASEGQVPGTQLFLQNLSPGSYRLTLYTGTDREKTALELSFYIKPAFWQTNAFLVAVIATALFLLQAGAYWLYRSTRKRTLKKASISRLLAEYKLTALKAQINPHFISNSLSAIQQLVLSGESDKASRYLALFSLLIRHVLQYSDKSLVPLSEELRIIDLNISLEQLRFSDQFSYEPEIDPDVDVHGLLIPPMITQPFVENAIWHGLLPLRDSRRARLTLRVRQDGDILILSVIDNGVGRKKQATSDIPLSGSRVSRGLSLTQSRIDNLNQLYSGVRASVSIVDLYGENGEQAGTQIDIFLPIIYDNAYGTATQEHHYRR